MATYDGDDGQIQENWEDAIANVPGIDAERADKLTDGVTEFANNAWDFAQPVLDFLWERTLPGFAFEKGEDIWQLIDTMRSEDGESVAEALNETTGSYVPSFQIELTNWADIRLGVVTQEGRNLPDGMSPDKDEVPDLGTRVQLRISAAAPGIDEVLSMVPDNVLGGEGAEVGVTFTNDLYARWTGDGPKGDGEPFALNRSQLALDAKVPFQMPMFEKAGATLNLLDVRTLRDEDFQDPAYGDSYDASIDAFEGLGMKVVDTTFFPSMVFGFDNKGGTLFQSVGGWWDNWLGAGETGDPDQVKESDDGREITDGYANSTLIGSSGDDTIDGGPGDDKMQGNAGDDVIIVDGDDSMTVASGLARGRIDGGRGQDMLRVAEGDTIDGWIQLERRGHHGDWGHDVTAIEHFHGNAHTDKVTDATTRATVLNGAGGADELYGNAGDDVINGGPGDDKLYGGEGDDNIGGGLGDDVLDGGRGDDVLVIEGGNQMGLREGSQRGHVDGGAGEDWVRLYDGHALGDWLQLEVRGVHGPWGKDAVAVENAAGNDLDNKIAATKNHPVDNVIEGHGGDDELHGHGGDDVIRGGDGTDKMHAGKGNDTVVVDNADAYGLVDEPNSNAGKIDGGPGEDTVKIAGGVQLDSGLQLEARGGHGPWGKDVVAFENATGNSQDNMIVDGTYGPNEIRGLAGDDELHGKGGDDLLIGGPGADIIHGDGGDDTVHVDPSDDPEDITGGMGTDTLVLTSFDMNHHYWRQETSGFDEFTYLG